MVMVMVMGVVMAMVMMVIERRKGNSEQQDTPQAMLSML
jgi:hypothetical protein